MKMKNVFLKFGLAAVIFMSGGLVAGNGLTFAVPVDEEMINSSAQGGLSIEILNKQMEEGLSKLRSMVEAREKGVEQEGFEEIIKELDNLESICKASKEMTRLVLSNYVDVDKKAVSGLVSNCDDLQNKVYSFASKHDVFYDYDFERFRQAVYDLNYAVCGFNSDLNYFEGQEKWLKGFLEDRKGFKEKCEEFNEKYEELKKEYKKFKKKYEKNKKGKNKKSKKNKNKNSVKDVDVEKSVKSW